MQTFEVTLKSGKKVYGLVSRIDHDAEEFYLLDDTTPGMIGGKTDGQLYRFEECLCVYALSENSLGVRSREPDEQIAAWRRFARTHSAA